MSVFAKSKSQAQGKFLRPPDDPTRYPPKRQPRANPQLHSAVESQSTQIALSPWVEASQTQQSAKSPGRQTSVHFDVPEGTSHRKKQRRNATLYDAVAGRVGPRGFHKEAPFASQHRDTASTGERTLAPEEVLIRRPHYLNSKVKGEPYFAHERLPYDKKLPNSDMLTAIHGYAADFYEYSMERTKPVYQSLDESALLAFGILAEELAKEGMGTTGYRCLLDDPEATDNEDLDNPIPAHLRTRKRRSEKFHDPNYRVVISQQGERFVRTRRKRAKSASEPEKKNSAKRARKPGLPSWFERELSRQQQQQNPPAKQEQGQPG